jgi:hypothetical protein
LTIWDLQTGRDPANDRTAGRLFLVPILRCEPTARRFAMFRSPSRDTCGTHPFANAFHGVNLCCQRFAQFGSSAAMDMATGSEGHQVQASSNERTPASAGARIDSTHSVDGVGGRIHCHGSDRPSSDAQQISSLAPRVQGPEALWLETAALARVVAPVEEGISGALVQPQAGVAATSVLFAAKHVAIDRRWRRLLGLALFGLGPATREVVNSRPRGPGILQCRRGCP